MERRIKAANLDAARNWEVGWIIKMSEMEGKRWLAGDP